jgi:hypothetical protein
MAITLLVVAAVAGAVAVIMGFTDAAIVIWIVGGIVAPWLILMGGRDSEGE